MARLTQRVKLLLLVGVSIAFIWVLKMGCEFLPESSFQLASDSRLPTWVALPPGHTRAYVSLTMDYYVKPWGRDARFTLQDKNGQVIKKVWGRLRCGEPFQLQHPPQGFPSGYPAYEEITVHGVTELIEHRKPEPIFYITDDPAVWKQYELNGCR